MKKYLSILILLALSIGVEVSAQNPFTEMLNDPETRAIIDIDIPTRDQVILDDLIVTGSACIGFDCANNESFGFDTIRLKENNLRIGFQDTSNSASFPTNDWEITINDSANGGANYFGVTDVTAGNRPFTVSAGAGVNALFVAGNGNVGLGTATPAVELQVTDGDTPTLRLEQNGSSGYPARTWDVAGNETNFFIRDVTGGSLLPFRIQPTAPTGSLSIGSNGGIGVGMNGLSFPNPNASIDLNASDKGLQLNRMDTAQRDALGTALGASEVGVVIFNTDDSLTYVWDGTNWSAIGSDDQALSLNVNSLDLEDGGSVDLSGYLDNTDDQNISGSGFAANMLTIGIEGGTSEVIDLSALDNSGTDDQALSLNVNSLDLEDGGSVDLSGYLDNTDDQDISGSGLAGNILTIGIEGGNSETVDLSSLNNTGTDNQQLTLNANTLTLEDGGSVDLSGYLDNTDSQTLGNFALTGVFLNLGISGGNSVLVNMSPLLQDLEDENAAQQVQIDNLIAMNAAQQAQIDDLIARMEAQEACECTILDTGDFGIDPKSPILYQNVPNPYDSVTTIRYFIPLGYENARIAITSSLGQKISDIKLTTFGTEGHIEVDKGRLQAAIYYYTLIVDGRSVDTKRMIVE
tara:strand:+ start:121821 stop:123719 length:1899 start_codon:yes stop_codon:yes gene_type:complete